MKKILVASGAFKDVFSPQEACALIGSILQDILGSEAQIVLQPMVDGGEHTREVLADVMGYERVVVSNLIDPVGHAHDVEYLVLGPDTAFISTSSVLALPAVYGDEFRNPLRLTSYGMGQLVRTVLDRGMKNIVIGFGGTSTVDAGIGLLQALGAVFYDLGGNRLSPACGSYFTGFDLGSIGGLDCVPAAADISVLALCDTRINMKTMRTPTALKVGANYEKDRESIVAGLEAALLRFAAMVEGKPGVGDKLKRWPGSGTLANKDFFGVAGGVLAGMLPMFSIQPGLGIDYIMDRFGLAQKVAAADLVVSGEGRFDITLAGKTPSGVARLAKEQGKPFICLCGTVGAELKPLFRSCICNDLPLEMRAAGFQTLISCHPEFRDDLKGQTYQQQLSYYRENTPLILANALRVYFGAGPAKSR